MTKRNIPVEEEALLCGDGAGPQSPLSHVGCQEALSARRRAELLPGASTCERGLRVQAEHQAGASGGSIRWADARLWEEVLGAEETWGLRKL